MRWLAHLWRRIWLRNAQFSGDYRRLDRLYLTRDPWQLASDAEMARFAQTNALILRQWGKIGHLLELGCGEGVQSAAMLDVCDQLTGLDVSQRAIGRARQRLPQARFSVGAAEDLASIFTGEAFDLVTACEVLYYSDRPDQIISAMQGVSGRILVTVYAPRFDKLRDLLSGAGWRDPGPIHIDGLTWHCRIWERSAVQ